MEKKEDRVYDIYMDCVDYLSSSRIQFADDDANFYTRPRKHVAAFEKGKIKSFRVGYPIAEDEYFVSMNEPFKNLDEAIKYSVLYHLGGVLHGKSNGCHGIYDYVIEKVIVYNDNVLDIVFGS